MLESNELSEGLQTGFLTDANLRKGRPAQKLGLPMAESKEKHEVDLISTPESTPTHGPGVGR